MLVLRNALFEPTGEDKNLFRPFQKAFARYEFEGHEYGFEHRSAKQLTQQERQRMLELAKTHLSKYYDDCGYGWVASERQEELRDRSARFLLVRDAERQVVAFVALSLSLEGAFFDEATGEPATFVEIHVDERVRRQGIGQRLLQIVELISRTNRINLLLGKVTPLNAQAIAYLSKHDWEKAQELDESGMSSYKKDLLAAAARSKESAKSNTSLKKPVPKLAAATAQDKENLDANALQPPPAQSPKMHTKRVSAPVEGSPMLGQYSVSNLHRTMDTPPKREKPLEKEKEALHGSYSVSNICRESPVATTKNKDKQEEDGFADEILQRLMEEYKEKTGEDATDEILQSWMETIKSADMEQLCSDLQA